MDEGVLIKIGADAKEFLSSLSDVSKGTDDLGDRLGAVGKASSVAFIGFTASIAASVYAYQQAEQVNLQLNNVIKSTGGIAGVTASEIDTLSQAISKKTAYDDDSIKAGAKVLLQYTRIGKETFPEATKAAVDLAASMGVDVATAARTVGLALEAPEKASRALRQANVILTESQEEQIKSMIQQGDRAKAQALILDLLKTTTEGMAEATAQGSGVFAQLANATGDLYKAMGKELAPAIEAVVIHMRDLVRWAAENEMLVKFAAWGTVALAAVTGLAAGIYAVTVAWGVMSGAMITVSGIIPAVQAALYSLIGEMGLLEAASVALGISVRTLVGATGIGLLLIIAYEVYEHWGTIWPAMQRIFFAFADNVGNMLQGLGKILMAVLLPSADSFAKIKEGAAQMAQAFSDGWKQAKGGDVMGPQEATAADKQKAADSARELAAAGNAARIKAEQAAQDARNKLLGQAEDANLKSRILALQDHSKNVVALKKQEGDLLAALAKSQSNLEKVELNKKLQETRVLFADAQKKELQQTKAFDNLMRQNDAAYQKLTVAQRRQFETQKKQTLMDGLNTAEDAQAEAFEMMLQRQIEADNLFLQEQLKYGTAYAEINRIMHSAVYEGANQGFAQLTQLTQSSNATLKAIGQVAATEQIAIKSAQGAMDAYAGFCTIPIIGPPLGILAAGAVILYGAEQISNVWAAADGGVMMGGFPGRDSIPTMTMPGELITPTGNFEEVIGSVAAQRAAKELGFLPGAGARDVNVVVSFKNGAGRFITAEINQDKALGRHRGT